MITTWYEDGIEKGRQETILLQVAKRFGSKVDVKSQIESMTEKQLKKLTVDLLDPAKGLEQLGLTGVEPVKTAKVSKTGKA